MTEAETFEPREFVYAGKREVKGGYGISVLPIMPDGSLGKKYLFSYDKEWRSRAVGSVYGTAQFSATSAKGLSGAKWLRMWPNSMDRAEWKASHDDAEEVSASRILEADARKMREIETILLQVRIRYEALRKQYDVDSMYALERAVVRALKTAPRVVETKGK